MQNDFRSRAQASLISIQQTCSMCPTLHCTTFRRRRISLEELHRFASRKPFIMIESSLVILPILSQYLKKRYLKLLKSCLRLTKTVNNVCVRSLNVAYVSITVSKPLGLSFDAALSSGKNFTRWCHFKQHNE